VKTTTLSFTIYSLSFIILNMNMMVIMIKRRNTMSNQSSLEVKSTTLSPAIISLPLITL